MGYPRAYLVDPDAPGFFHCVSRCVRRAWLCGDDPHSGLSFDHRRDWIEQRMTDLAQNFAVGLYAWAVMSNHAHLVLYVDPGAEGITGHPQSAGHPHALVALRQRPLQQAEP